MTQDQYLEQITKYLQDSRYNQALLIDGEWGSGKTYFVDHVLKDAIKGMEVKNSEGSEKETDFKLFKKNKDPNEKRNYIPVMVSLYGLTTIESLQSQIFTSYMASKHGTSNLYMLVGDGVLGTAAEGFSVSEHYSKITKRISKTMLECAKDHLILIFDDLERCQIDIITLMGFLNNLCENIGYKIVIIAHENEIAKIYAQNRGDNEENQDFSLYKRTKEKLIGRTIYYKTNIEEKYEAVLNDNIKDSDGDSEKEKSKKAAKREVFTDNKDFIIQEFYRANHFNLRTLKNIFIAGDYLLDAILSTDISSLKKGDKYDDFLDVSFTNLKTEILQYLSRNSITIAKGEHPIIWSGNSRYSRAGNADEKTIRAFAFVDEYLNYLTVDQNIIQQDVLIVLKACLSLQKERDKQADYDNLSLFRLKNWMEMEDEDVKADLEHLKAELADKKYLSSDFGEIIRTLMFINNKYAGLINPYSFIELPDKTDTEFDFMDAALDTLYPDSSEEENEPEDEHSTNYDEWKPVEISEYVDLMFHYFDDPDFFMRKDELSIRTDDKKYALAYRKNIDKLLEQIKSREIKRSQKNIKDINAFYKWDDGLKPYLDGMMTTYINEKRFMSLYDLDKILGLLKNATTKEVNIFKNGISHIYRTNNFLNDTFDNDNEIVATIHSALQQDEKKGRKHFNSKRSRTKEIALFALDNDLDYYLYIINR